MALKKLSGLSSGSSSNKNTSSDQLANLQAIAAQMGIEEPKKKESLLQKMSRVLNVGRAFTAGIQKYGITGGLKGISENLDTAKLKEEALGRELTLPEKAQAIGTDILLDPLTYLTFGTGAGAKIATQEGAKILTTSGTKALAKEGGSYAARLAAELGAKAAEGKIAPEVLAKLTTEEALTKAGKVHAERLFADGIAKGDPAIMNMIDKGGLKIQLPFAGQGSGKTIISGDKFAAVADKAAEKISKVPVLGKVVETTKDTVGKLFSPNYDVNKVVKNLRKSGVEENIKLANKIEKYPTMFSEMANVKSNCLWYA